MLKTLEEVLLDPVVMASMKNSPRSFRFAEAPKVVVSATHWSPHTIVVEKAPADVTSTDGSNIGGGQEIDVQGPTGNLLRMLANAFNFTYSLTRSPDGTWGAEFPNGSWSGMIGQIHRQEADLALGPFAQSESRARVVDFTSSFYFDGRGIVSRKGLPVIDPWGFLLPLSPLVWAGLAGSLILAWLTMMMVSYAGTGSAGKHNWASSLLFQHIRVLLCQGIQKRFVRHGRERLLAGSWLLLVLMVLWSYSGNLISQLAVRHIPQPIQGIRSLIDSGGVVILPFKSIFSNFLADDKGSAGELAELSSLGEVGRIVYKEVRTFPVALDTLVRQGDHSMISLNLWSTEMLADLFAKTGKCDFYRSRQTFFPTLHCLIGRKGSPLLPLMSEKISRVVESGLYDFWLKNMIPFSDACSKSPSKITVKEPMALSNLWGLFALMGSGYLPALLVFLLELLLQGD